MKRETVEKIVKRYIKNLEYLESESELANESLDTSLYRRDKEKMITVMQILDGNTPTKMEVIRTVKLLKRFASGLAAMEAESIIQSMKSNAEHYKIERLALKEAINIIERSNI